MGQGKLGERTLLASTDIELAIKFDTKEACEAWIAAHPEPKFVAREHAWATEELP